MTKQSNNNLTISDKIIKLQNSISTKQQLILVRQIVLEELDGQQALLDLLINRRIINKLDLSYLDSIIFEALYNSNIEKVKQGLSNYLPDGLINVKSFLSMDYQPLQNLLINHKYQEADKLTHLYLCKLVGLDKKNQRNWLYFTDISLLTSEDLYIIDKLWSTYSRNKFGFSKQREIWLANNCNWEKLWIDIGWRSKGMLLRYPNEFTWNINAPHGHLPLFNQLRGVQVLSALFNHIIWS
uniref:GUN4-like domain-containing protein n=1 Tax=Leiomenia cribrosa TaxID=217483 RepID=A0A4D6WUP1_9FLOR|nr:hypothetical protein [Leiomenia cribrosa]